MNANEAISKIRFMLDVGGSDGFTSADKEALNMAINALSAEISAPPKSNEEHTAAYWMPIPEIPEPPEKE